MRRRRARLRWWLLGAVGCGALGFAACSSSSAPPAAATSDAGLDAATVPPSDGATFDTSLIPPPEDASGGGPCATAADCPSGLLCLFPLAEACSAHGVCAPNSGDCGGPYCTCAGTETAACGAFGYAPMPTPLHGPPCGAGAVDGGDAGESDAAEKG